MLVRQKRHNLVGEGRLVGRFQARCTVHVQYYPSFLAPPCRLSRPTEGKGDSPFYQLEGCRLLVHTYNILSIRDWPSAQHPFFLIIRDKVVVQSLCARRTVTMQTPEFARTSRVMDGCDPTGARVCDSLDPVTPGQVLRHFEGTFIRYFMWYVIKLNKIVNVTPYPRPRSHERGDWCGRVGPLEVMK